MFKRQSARPSHWLFSSFVLLFAFAGTALADPPSRVARLSYVGGDVSMQAAGLDEWSEARINRPLITGDGLYTDRASRVEMEIGAATLRLDERTSFRVLNLDDDQAQVELTSGTLNLTVRRVFEGQTYEVDTPTLAFVIDSPGQYRIDIAPEGDSTMVSVVDGSGDVYGRDNASFRVRDGQSYRFHDDQLTDYEVLDLPRDDDFDRWCYERADRYRNSPSARYVSEEVIGYADLDDYGTWSSAPTYGSIWYPSRVDAGWTPYRNGHWSWIDPWGWTWVDNYSWGFAPSHYGRWAYVGSRWGWVPGPRNVRPIYAPALVAFVGGGGFGVSISSGGPVGWFPLGPRDVYVPWYQGSRNYFNNINVRNTTIINNTYITNVYNDYSRGRPITNFNYAYRGNQRAFTAVSRDDFINARAVDRSRVQIAQNQLARSEVVSRIQVTPTARSFSGGAVARGDNGRGIRSASFDRRVIARSAPPAREMNAQARIQAISRNDNQPLAISQMREIAERKPANAQGRAERVQVVGGGRNAAAPRALPERGDAADRQGRGSAQTGKPRNPRDADAGRAAPVRPVDSRENARGVTRPRDTSTDEGSVRAPRSDTTKPRAIERDLPGNSRDQRQSERESPTVRREPTVRAPQQRKPAVDRDSIERTERAPQENRAPREIQQRQSDRREESAPTPERRAIQAREPERGEVQQREQQDQRQQRQMRQQQQQDQREQQEQRQQQQMRQQQDQRQQQQEQRQQQQMRQQQQQDQRQQQQQQQQQQQRQPQQRPPQDAPQRGKSRNDDDKDNDDKEERKRRE
ncbi:MAG TPA: hypothetical protein PLR28_09005 [Dokdonella sp.]|uniref:DUF6600 domain-containing protein n=1 Tax=Dokdonella sp. TaxID=2291710 RepID=UPI002CFCAD95|nr:DUF6600 domain-containing protein [Dokdonella sp.]HPG94677.1 hypothetical protein [Dokdonella sp.]HPN80451.1 hypothetical protein [Dokdonella sp.]